MGCGGRGLPEWARAGVAPRPITIAATALMTMLRLMFPPALSQKLQSSMTISRCASMFT